MWETIRNYLSETAHFDDLTINIVSTIFVVFAIWFMQKVVMRVVQERTDNAKLIYNWRKGIGYVGLVVGAILIIQIWFDGFDSISTYFGLLSAGLAIALQAPITNLFGWAFIISKRPFEVGERISIGDHSGDVIDIDFFQFSMLEIGNWVKAEQSTGRVLRIPNKQVFDHPIGSYTAGIPVIWNELPVEITFESNWQEAKKIVEEVINENTYQINEQEATRIRAEAKKANIYLTHIRPIVYTDVAPSGVVLTMRYLTKPRQRRMIEQRVWEALLTRFAERSDIDFAYPTQRIFYHPAEGKTPITDHQSVSDLDSFN